ncbi:MAG: FeoB-associated Cys-rich membrane protein [Clostridia bacterium]|nr:FeoB-associated Cys-rich membrane protein [Clostridia bacterium]
MGDIIVLVALGCAVAAVIFSIIKKRKKTGGSCGCGCSSCAHHAYCHGNNKTFTE